jgi:hypothetical protein
MGGSLDVSFGECLTVRPSKPAVSGLIVYLLSICRNSQTRRSQSVAICKAGEWFIPLTGFRMRACETERCGTAGLTQSHKASK